MNRIKRNNKKMILKKMSKKVSARINGALKTFDGYYCPIFSKDGKEYYLYKDQIIEWDILDKNIKSWVFNINIENIHLFNDKFVTKGELINVRENDRIYSGQYVSHTYNFSSGEFSIELEDASTADYGGCTWNHVGNHCCHINVKEHPDWVGLPAQEPFNDPNC